MTGLAFQVPVVFARKSKSLIQDQNSYSASVFSYTKQVNTQILVNANFIQPQDNILIIDDFLANGEAAKGLIQIVHQAKCSLAGIGIVIEKAFQPGGRSLRQAGFNLKSLVRIKSLENRQVTFVEDKSCIN